MAAASRTPTRRSTRTATSSRSTNSFRGGDLVSNATGVLDYRFERRWRVQPTAGRRLRGGEPAHREPVPEVGGTTKVASFNVLNYFTTSSRTRATAARTTRRSSTARRRRSSRRSPRSTPTSSGSSRSRTTATSPSARSSTPSTTEMGAGTYDFISTGELGTDAITDGAHLQAGRGRAGRVPTRCSTRVVDPRLRHATATVPRWRRPSPISKPAARSRSSSTT